MAIADRATYRQHVNDVLTFLEGDSQRLATRIQDQIDQAATRLDFERARRLRDNLGVVAIVAESQKRLRESVARHTLLLVQPSAEAGAREIVMVIEGKRWAQFRARPDEEVRDLAVRLARSFGRVQSFGVPTVDHASLDDTLILNRWLFQQPDHPATMPFSIEGETIDWNFLAEWALGLTDSELTYVAPSSPPDPIETADADLVLQPGEESFPTTFTSEPFFE